MAHKQKKFKKPRIQSNVLTNQWNTNQDAWDDLEDLDQVERVRKYDEEEAGTLTNRYVERRQRQKEFGRAFKQWKRERKREGQGK